MTDEMIVPLTIAVAAFFAALAGAYLLIGNGRRLAGRVQSIRARFGGAPMAAERGLRRDGPGGWERRIARLMPHPEALRRRLDRAGLGLSVGRYGAVSALVGVLAGAGAAAMFGLSLFAAVMVALAGGGLLPHLYVRRRINRRSDAFLRQFPEALDLMVRGLRSGLPITETMINVGEEMPPPVGAEFRAITDAIRLGATLEEALWQAVRRMDTAEFKFFVITLSIQRETGGNLGETLANLADILRKRLQMRLKVRAMSSEARASAYIIGALPFVMFAILAVMSPEYVFLLFSDPRGMMLIAVGGMMMLMGVIVMVKMVRFEI